jgi:LacI family transcriptional regulator
MAETGAPKYLELSQEIEGRIRLGQWRAGRMPSVRGIAAAHGVSAVTASRALQVLHDKGLIHTVGRSGCYLANPKAAAGDRFALQLRVTPGQYRRAADSAIRRGFEEQARRQGLVVVDEPFELAAPGDGHLLRQVRRAATGGLRGLFLMPSRVSDADLRVDERLLRACRAARLPVVFVERNLRGHARPIEYDIVGMDDVGAGAALTRHLLDRGRKRVAVVVASPISTHDDRVAGYLGALHAAGPDRHPPLVLHERTDLARKAAYARLADDLLAARADAAVCYSDYTAVGLMVELFARGLRVPADVALTGFDDLPIGDQFAVGVTTYAPPAEEVARQAVRVMRERIQFPDAPPVKVVVPGALIVRESSGA